MVPAHERLDAGDPIGLQVDDRLVPDDELVAVERVPQLALDGEPRCWVTSRLASKMTTRSRPCCLACCVAIPASRTRPVASPGLRATPMLTVTKTS